MHLVVPAVHSVRTLYALNSDRVWFALAVIAGLIVAAELAQWASVLMEPAFAPSVRL